MLILIIAIWIGPDNRPDNSYDKSKPSAPVHLAQDHSPQSPTSQDHQQPILPQSQPARLAIIRKRPDFLAANKGRRVVRPGFILLALRRDGTQRADPAAIRFGITVTKKVGNAVIRNRMKRRFRELLRALLVIKGKPGYDYVMIGRAGEVERDFTRLHEELSAALDQLAAKTGQGQGAATIEAIETTGLSEAIEAIKTGASAKITNRTIASQADALFIDLDCAIMAAGAIANLAAQLPLYAQLLAICDYRIGQIWRV